MIKVTLPKQKTKPKNRETARKIIRPTTSHNGRVDYVEKAGRIIAGRPAFFA